MRHVDRADRLRAAMATLRWSVRDAHVLSGYGEATISSYTRGITSAPDDLLHWIEGLARLVADRPGPRVKPDRRVA